MKPLLPTAIPKGSIALAAGTGVLGLTTYVFLVVAGHVLGDARYAPLGAMWVLVFLVAPGVFFPVEQEVARAMAARRALGQGVRPVFTRAAVLTSGVAVLLVVVFLAAAPIVGHELFDDQALLIVGVVACMVTFALGYLARGLLAGNHRLIGYGWLITIEGLSRVVLAVSLAAGGVETAGPFGLVVALAPLIAVVSLIPTSRRLMDEGPRADWRELSTSLGRLIAASVFAQILANAAPLVVKYSTTIAQQGLAGAFTKAVIITRIPLFLFQALQAAMLPRLTHLATSAQHSAFKATLVRYLLIVSALAVGGTIAITALAPQLLAAFGSDNGLPRRDMAILAVGNGLFLLAMTTAQALVALRFQSKTVFGWGSGVLVFAVVTALPGDAVLGVEIALLAGSATAFGSMAAYVAGATRAHVSGDELQLVDDELSEGGPQVG